MSTTNERNDRGWNVYMRRDGAWVVQLRVTSGEWRERRVPASEEIPSAIKGTSAYERAKKRAAKWAGANIERLRAGEPTKPEAPATLRVRDLRDPYVAIRGKSGVRPATLHQDETVLDAHVVPILGDYEPRALDSANLLGFVDALKAKKLAPSTIRNVLFTVRTFLDVIKVRKLAPLDTNPTRDPEFIKHGFPALPKKGTAGKVVLTLDEAERLIACDAVPEARRVRYLLAFTSGMRDGEIAAIQWRDLTLDGELPHLQVTKSAALRGEKHSAEIGPTKTEGSERELPLHPDAAKALRAWKLGGWVRHVGRHARPEDFVFPSEGGDAVRPRSADHIRIDLKRAGCPTTIAGRNVDFHATRRSFATFLARAGVEPAMRKLLMGHSLAADVTEANYVEHDLAMKLAAVSRIRLNLTRGKVIVIGPKKAANGPTETAALTADLTAEPPPRRGKGPTQLLAEEERFELPVRCRTAVFKTAALDHSATPPDGDHSSAVRAAGLARRTRVRLVPRPASRGLRGRSRTCRSTDRAARPSGKAEPRIASEASTAERADARGPRAPRPGQGVRTRPRPSRAGARADSRAPRACRRALALRHRAGCTPTQR
jgi:integrase